VEQPERSSPETCLVARLQTEREAEYLKVLEEVYYPGLCTQEGFQSVRLLRWHIRDNEYLRITTWAKQAQAEHYLTTQLHESFKAPMLGLSKILDFAPATIKLDRFAPGQ
jgi:heme-degrading monooxygenase HmoA